jgi:hypothetical protein
MEKRQQSQLALKTTQNKTTLCLMTVQGNKICAHSIAYRVKVCWGSGALEPKQKEKRMENATKPRPVNFIQSPLSPHLIANFYPKKKGKGK